MYPTSILITEEQLNKLTIIVEWYDNMPSCLSTIVGDRFHENVSEFLCTFIPESIKSTMDVYGVVTNSSPIGIEVDTGTEEPLFIPFEVSK